MFVQQQAKRWYSQIGLIPPTELLPGKHMVNMDLLPGKHAWDAAACDLLAWHYSLLIFISCITLNDWELYF